MWHSLSKTLDAVYRWAAYGAGVLLVLLCGLVLYSILARLIDLYAGGAADIAGYVMATSTFMAMAYTFRSNGHIRVALLIQRMTGTVRRGVELFCLGFMALITAFIAVYMIRLAWDSYVFGERSQGADAILMWIPQTPVALGSLLFAVAALHTFLLAVFDHEQVNPETAADEGPNEV